MPVRTHSGLSSRTTFKVTTRLAVNPAEKVVDAGNVDREDVYTSNATPFLPIVTARELGRTTSSHQGSGPSGMMA